MTALIHVDGLTHDYRQVRALDGVTLDVPPGLTGLVGANGAGKTTLIRILLGMLQPSAGSVEVLSADVRSNPLAARERVGYMPETSCLPIDQTAADFVGFAAELAGLPPKVARRRASEILFLVGLHEERFRFIGDFSTGMLQRVKLAQAIVHDPELVYLDEPASGLDPEGREEMIRLIRRLGDFDISVVFSSHILGDIEQTCDWVVMLDGGRVLRSGPLESLGSRDQLTVRVLGDGRPLAEWLGGRGAHVELDGSTLQLRSVDAPVYDLVRDGLVATGTGLHSLGVAAVTLEEAFFLDEEGDTA